MSESCVVPEAEAFVVEYPGYVRNVQAMMQTLGGSNALAAAVNGSNSVLQLRFRPDDLMSHPLYGERQATNGLLLKLSRPDAAPENPRVSAEVVARVHSKFTFTGMADYQYLPVDTSVSASASCSSTGPYGEEVQPLLCIPPLFTKSDVPLDYAFKQFKAPDKPVNRPKPSPQWLVAYTVQQVPSSRASETTMPGAVSSTDSSVQAQLASRPIWTQSALSHTMPTNTGIELDAALPNICYQFKDGPWKGAWIKRSYDPRADSSSWRYQTLQYNLPPDWYAKMSARDQQTDQNQAAAGPSEQPLEQAIGPVQKPLDQVAAGPTAQPSDQAKAASLPQHSPAIPSFDAIHRFEVLPTAQSTILQLCDLSSVPFEAVLSQVKTQETCNPVTGWVSQDQWQAIVDAVSEGFGKLL